jgi:FkbM family methyltransferase
MLVTLRRLRRLAERLGLASIPREAVVTVGGFPLAMDFASPLRAIFEGHPDYTGELARIVAATMPKYPDAAMIDIGANVGDTVAVARSAAALPILCFEGDPTVFPFLERNIKQFPGVTAHRVFLGERSETIAVDLEKAGWNTTIVPRTGGRGSDLELTALDDFLSTHATPGRYKVLKVDAEGFDARILRGAARLLAESRPVILFEYNRYNMAAIGEPGLPLFAWLQGLGYSSAFFYDARGRFVLATTLEATQQVRDLHEYADGWNSPIPYFDVCVFHSEDADIAAAFAARERAHRAANSGEEAWQRRQGISSRRS